MNLSMDDLKMVYGYNICGNTLATENQQDHKINGFYGQHSWVFDHEYFTRYKVGEVIRYHS